MSQPIDKPTTKGLPFHFTRSADGRHLLQVVDSKTQRNGTAILGVDNNLNSWHQFLPSSGKQPYTFEPNKPFPAVVNQTTNTKLNRPVEITPKNFTQYIAKGKHVLFVGAEWCKHCQHLKGLFAKTAAEQIADSGFAHMESVGNEDFYKKVITPLYAQLGIPEADKGGVPFLIAFEDGKPVAGQVGISEKPSEGEQELLEFAKKAGVTKDDVSN